MLGTWGMKKEKWKCKIWVNAVGFPSAFEFYKLCLTVKTKTITLSGVVLNECRGNLKDSYKWEWVKRYDLNTLTGGNFSTLY